jgi:hypothetical protein
VIERLSGQDSKLTGCRLFDVFDHFIFAPNFNMFGGKCLSFRYMKVPQQALNQKLPQKKTHPEVLGYALSVTYIFMF